MTQSNHNALSPIGTDPSATIAAEHLAKLHDLELGKSYDMSPATPLCSSEDIGIAAEQPNPITQGVIKYTVVGEFTIPDNIDENTREFSYKHLAALAATTAEGQSAYLIVGLHPDPDTGRMIAAVRDGKPDCWIHASNPTGFIGRGEGAINPQNLWGVGEQHNSATSRRHIAFSLQPDGKLRAEMLGTNGTKGDIGRVAPGMQEKIATNPVKSQESLQPNPELRFQPVEKDAAFQQISQPFETALKAIDDKYAAEGARLRVEYEHDQNSGRMREAEISAARTQLYKKIEAEKAPIRVGYEAAVKPYLEARLRLFNGDKIPGYAHPRQVELDRFGAKSKDGKQISRYDQFASRNGTACYSQDSVFPRFGQLIIDARGSSAWGASWTAEKKDDRTGQKMTSAQRVVDLAAAMIAGTFTGSDDPIQYRRVNSDELSRRGIDLPTDFLNKVPIYKVTLGIHRTIAERLIAGNDAVFQGDQLDQ